MRFDLESAGPSIADINDASVLARPLHHAPAARRQPLQMHAGRFVGAMLAPHHAEDAKLGDGGLASAEKLFDLLVFFRREAVFANHFWSDGKSRGRGHGEILLSHLGNETAVGLCHPFYCHPERIGLGLARDQNSRRIRLFLFVHLTYTEKN